MEKKSITIEFFTSDDSLAADLMRRDNPVPGDEVKLDDQVNLRYEGPELVRLSEALQVLEFVLTLPPVVIVEALTGEVIFTAYMRHRDKVNGVRIGGKLVPEPTAENITKVLQESVRRTDVDRKKSDQAAGHQDNSSDVAPGGAQDEPHRPN